MRKNKRRRASVKFDGLEIILMCSCIIYDLYSLYIIPKLHYKNNVFIMKVTSQGVDKFYTSVNGFYFFNILGISLRFHLKSQYGAEWHDLKEN